MPVKRDSDGNIIEEPTRRADRSGSGSDSPADVTRQKPASPVTIGTNRGSAYDAKTMIAGTARLQDKEQADKSTRIYRPSRQADKARADSAPQPNAATNKTMEDPPVGWLVVINGPGKGNVVTLGNGANSMGRDATGRLSLDFGDEMISRSGHATISYDPRGKKFYIQHGGGTNLIYVNDHPVLTPEELQPGTNILIGNTTLRFVPLCGQQFDWDMQETD